MKKKHEKEKISGKLHSYHGVFQRLFVEDGAETGDKTTGLNYKKKDLVWFPGKFF